MRLGDTAASDDDLALGVENGRPIEDNRKGAAGRRVRAVFSNDDDFRVVEDLGDGLDRRAAGVDCDPSFFMAGGRKGGGASRGSLDRVGTLVTRSLPGRLSKAAKAERAGVEGAVD